MAVDFGGQDITAVSGADLTGKRFYAVMFRQTGMVGLALAGRPCLGILQNEPADDGKIARVRISGVSKVMLSDPVDEGVELAANAYGMMVRARAGDYVVAIAIEHATLSCEIIRAILVNYQKNA